MEGVPIIIKPQCLTCKHWVSPGTHCAAFPEGVPKDILMNIVDHKVPVKGDNGIQYETR